MVASYNRVVLVGNVTREIELKYTQSGMAVVELGLAVNEKRKNAAGEWVDEAVFVDITFWGKTAEVCGEHVTKGQQILVEGRLKLDTWQDRNTNEKRSKLKVVGDKLVFVGSKQDRAASAPPSSDEGYRPSGAAPNPPATQYDEPPRAATAGEPEDSLPF
jgi:single-strand DNA-binding protein